MGNERTRRVAQDMIRKRFGSTLALAIFLGGLALAGLVGCSKSDDPIGDTNRAPSRPARISGADSVLQGFSESYNSWALDPDNDAVSITFLWGDGDTSLVALTAGDSSASAEHAYSVLGSFRAYSVAEDAVGLRSDSSDLFRIHVFTPGPFPPQAPSGADTVYVDSLYMFSAATRSLLNTPFHLEFDWGDETVNGTTTTDSGVASFTAHHFYQNSDTGQVLIKVRSVDDDGHVSKWSAAKFVQVVNRPPVKPDPPLGDTLQIAGVSLMFQSSTSDPEGDELRFTFLWGDGTFDITRLDHHLTEFTMFHIFEDTGIYNVRTVATDVFGNISDTSEALTVHLPTFRIDTIRVSSGGIDKKTAFAKKNEKGIMFLHDDDTNEEHRFKSLGLELFNVEVSKNQLSQIIYFDVSGLFQYRCELHPNRESEKGEVQVNP